MSATETTPKPLEGPGGPLDDASRALFTVTPKKRKLRLRLNRDPVERDGSGICLLCSCPRASRSAAPTPR